MNKSGRLLLALAVALICIKIFTHSAYQTWILLQAKPPVENILPAISQVPSTDIISQLLKANLFKGDSGATPTDFSLLTLRGTFAGSGNTPSYAIIVENGQPEKGFRVGDRTANGAVVREIAAGYVVFEKDGNAYTLRLKEKK